MQGFSATLPAGHGRYWVMADNGYGSIENSADFDLRVYLIEPRLETAGGGPGTIAVKDFFELRDPGHEIPFAIVNAFTRDRVLTGADFDIESVQRDRDGTLWFGDEFGPFLLHTTAGGRVLHAPYPLPDPDHPAQEIRAPQNPFGEESSTLRVMNAMRADAQAHGDTKTPVVSPDANSTTTATRARSTRSATTRPRAPASRRRRARSSTSSRCTRPASRSSRTPSTTLPA